MRHKFPLPPNPSPTPLPSLPHSAEDDYDDVRKAVLDVAYRWTHISTAFGIKPSKRKTITDRDVQVCLGEVFLGVQK